MGEQETRDKVDVVIEREIETDRETDRQERIETS